MSITLLMEGPLDTHEEHFLFFSLFVKKVMNRSSGGNTGGVEEVFEHVFTKGGGDMIRPG